MPGSCGKRFYLNLSRWLLPSHFHRHQSFRHRRIDERNFHCSSLLGMVEDKPRLLSKVCMNIDYYKHCSYKWSLKIISKVNSRKDLLIAWWNRFWKGLWLRPVIRELIVVVISPVIIPCWR